MKPQDLSGISAAPQVRPVLILREPRARARSRRAVRASIFAFLLISGAPLLGVVTKDWVAWLLIAVTGILAIWLQAIDDIYWGIWESLPYRPIRSRLVITPESVGFREAHRPLTLNLDGQPLSLGVAPRIELTRDGDFYYINLLLGRTILVLDSVKEYEAVCARAHELSTAIGLTSAPLNPPVDVPKKSDLLAESLAVRALVTLMIIFGAARWIADVDLPDYVGLPLLLAGLLAGSLFVLVRSRSLRLLRVEAGLIADQLHHVTLGTGAPVRHENPWLNRGTFAAASILVVSVPIAVFRLEEMRLPESTSNGFKLREPLLCTSDKTGDGVPEVLSLSRSEGNWKLSAIEAKSGKIVASQPAEGVKFAESDCASPPPDPGLRIAEGVAYSLTGVSRLTLSSWRGEALLWSTRLPARPLEGLPLAVAGGMVVVGANDVRTGKHLRILGVNAATGEIRYVHRHPHDASTPVDLVAAGDMVFVEAGRLVGLKAATGEIAWITGKNE